MCRFPCGQGDAGASESRVRSPEDTPPDDYTTTSPLEGALRMTVHPLPGGAYVQEEVGGSARGQDQAVEGLPAWLSLDQSCAPALVSESPESEGASTCPAGSPAGRRGQPLLRSSSGRVVVLVTDHRRYQSHTAESLTGHKPMATFTCVRCPHGRSEDGNEESARCSEGRWVGGARRRQFPRHQHACDPEGRDRRRAGSGSKAGSGADHPWPRWEDSREEHLREGSSPAKGLIASADHEPAGTSWDG